MATSCDEFMASNSPLVSSSPCDLLDKSYMGIGDALFGVMVFLIVIILASLLCGLGCCLYLRYRRRQRRGYTRIDSTRVAGGRGLTSSANLNSREDVATVMRNRSNEEERRKREVALLTCQFYLRSMHHFIFDQQLPDIGSRVSKNWFLVKEIRGTTNILLTMLPMSQHCRLNLHEDKDVLKRLIRILHQTTVHGIESIDYIHDRNCVVIMETFHERGSLKDLLYQTTPNLSWSTKYSISHSGLRLKQIKLYGRQVLQGVLFMHHLGFKPFGQIQSGNIYLAGRYVKVSGFENQLLGYKPRIYHLVQSYRNKIDSAMFGHLIFELSSGRELSTSHPSEAEVASIPHEPIREVLNFIFRSESREVPSIEDISNHPFFCDKDAPNLENHWSYEGVKLDEDMKRLILKSRTGKVNRQLARNRRSRSSSHATAKYPVFQASDMTSLAPIAQSPNTIELSETNIDHSDSSTTGMTEHQRPRPQPRTTTPPPRPSVDRSALLGDIRTGTTLRKTVTNDRSAPILR